MRVSEAFAKAGFKAPVVSDVRSEIWTKLWGNLSFNPISALTHATLEGICRFAPTRGLAADMMAEAQAVGEALGIRFRISLEKRIAGAEAVGAHKTSMLQDVETGRAIEADALLGSVIELGRMVGIATPHMDAIYAVAETARRDAGRRQGPARHHAGVTRGANGMLVGSNEMSSEMNSLRTFEDLLASGRADDVAIAAPGAAPLTYTGLRALVAETIASLNRLGVGRGDRAAIVLPNGPDMATAFIAIASGATSAPLNPSYRTDEFEFYMSDLNAKALIVEAGSTSPAIAAAHKLGVAILTLTPDHQRGAGVFTLSGEAKGAAAQPGRAEAGDVALILHTSGTTSRPKIVPLTQANVAKSADNIATALHFTAQDRGLNVMPLFHIHGLIAGLLAPLSRGGSVYLHAGIQRAEVLRRDG